MKDEAASSSLIGARLKRVEDERLLRGEGRFVADFTADGMTHAVVLRSPVACARLCGVDTREAMKTPGAVAAFTGEHAARDGLGGIPWEVCPPGFETRARRQGDPEVAGAQPVLARDALRYVGEPVAILIGATIDAAEDMAERVALDYEEQAAVIAAPLAALSDWAAPAGAAFSAEVGDADAALTALREAAHVVELTTEIPRLAAAPLETRGYLASYDEAADAWTVIVSAGKPHPVRDTIAERVLHVDPRRIRVVAPDIGGGFGAKNVAHAEMALVLWAARNLRRPVRWLSTRNESFVSDMQGRGHRVAARLGLDAQGRMTALTYRSLVDLGAYLGPRAVVPSVSGLKVATGPYRIPDVAGRVDAFHTNNVPTCPYRGAGVPEAAFVLERLVDMAARKLGIAPDALRARNLVRTSDLPYAMPTGATLHSVDFEGLFGQACGLWRGLSPESSDGLLRGRGMAFTIETYGASFDEAAEIVAHGDGSIEILIGTKSSGQSHETTYAQIAAQALGARIERFTIVQGDTARIARGNGTGASRSITTGGCAILRAIEALIDVARPQAAALLQRQPEEIRYDSGRFHAVEGASVDLAEIAAASPGGELRASGAFRPDGHSFPHGCHMASVEVDPETGEVRLLSYVAVQDAGVAINPTVAEAQLAGGVAQGVGAALGERLVVDERGQPLTASFLDYAVPRADSLSRFETQLRGVPCASNPLGAKAIGEAGAVAAPPAVVNAIVDALAPLGVAHVDLPATPARVWAAIRAAQELKKMEEPNG